MGWSEINSIKYYITVCDVYKSGSNKKPCPVVLNSCPGIKKCETTLNNITQNDGKVSRQRAVFLFYFIFARFLFDEQTFLLKRCPVLSTVLFQQIKSTNPTKAESQMERARKKKLKVNHNRVQRMPQISQTGYTI